MTYATTTRLELAELLIEVLEKPAEKRIIVSTQIPSLDNPEDEDDCVYYMVDKSDGDDEWEAAGDGSITKVKSAEVYDGWRVSSSEGNCSEFPAGFNVLNFFERLAARTAIEAHVESF